MTSASIDLLDQLQARRLLAIVRGRNPEAAFRSLMILVEEEITLAEVSLTSTDALNVLERACAEGLVLGAGTVLTADDARRAADAGAAFIVSPCLGEGVEKGLALGLPVLAGALTPSEIVAGHRLGATAIKVFPASVVGSEYLRALVEPLPDIPLVAVGGIGPADVAAYLAAGAVAVGVGSPLLGDAAHGGDLADLRLRARRLLSAVVQASNA